MHYVYKYALQEDSLLKCFKSYFEEKNLLLYTIFGWTLGSLAGRLHINRPEGKPTARIHHYFFTCETEMVLCGHVYCSNCILKSVLVEVKVHTSIRNKKDSKSSGKTYSHQAVVDNRGSAVVPKEGHTAQPHANTSITATITTALAHTQVANAPDSPVQAVDLAQKEKITSQANLPSNKVVILSNDVTETGESIKYSSKIGKYYLKTVK